MIPDPVIIDKFNVDDFPLDHLIVVIFGPGSGEAVALRTPDGRWGVVDGCGAGPDNAVCELLSEVGVTRLLFAALTHPHADHLEGLDEAIRSYLPEHVWWAGESHPRMFNRYVRLLREKLPDRQFQQHESQKDSPANLLARFTLAIRTARDSKALGVALSDEKLLLRHALPGGPGLVIRGVLPTTRSVQRGLSWLHGNLRASPGAEAPSDLEPHDGDINELSGALLIEWGHTRVLLGGDALIGPRRNNDRGWRWWAARHRGSCQLVKVPHHGSSGAFDRALWDLMQPKLAVVTPYHCARGTMPPRPDMLKTLLALGPVALTTRPAWWEEEGHGLQGFPPPPPPLTGVPGRGARARGGQGAVAVSLDSQGNIVNIWLRGGAALLSQT